LRPLFGACVRLKNLHALYAANGGFTQASANGRYASLQLLGGLLAEGNMTPALSAVNGLRGIAGMYFHSDLKPKLKTYITQSLTPWYERLGTETRADDSDSARDLRLRVLRTLAEFGDKPE